MRDAKYVAKHPKTNRKGKAMIEAIFFFGAGLITGWFLFPAPAFVARFWRRLFGGEG